MTQFSLPRGKYYEDFDRQFLGFIFLCLYAPA